MMSKAASARVNYVRFLWKEGIETTEYIFRYDEDNHPRLCDMSSRDAEEPPCVKVTDSFVRELEQLLEQGNVLSYAASYEPEEALCGGYVWELSVKMDDGQSVYSSGHSVQPENSIIPGLGLMMRSYLAKQISNKQTIQIKQHY